MPTGLSLADTTTLSNSQGLTLFLVVVVGILSGRGRCDLGPQYIG